MASPAPDHRRPLRRVEYDQLVALGTFERERIELINGELRRMSPIGASHNSTVDRLTKRLVLALAEHALVRVQGSFAAGDLSEPEPDFSILPDRDYDDGHPEEAHLIIEVADSSLRYDRTEKAQLYAERGVPEYWIVNLVDRVVEVHTEPRDGHYQTRRVHGKGEQLQLLAFPDVTLAIDDFLR
jgi:Uma2 family endonuclease